VTLISRSATATAKGLVPVIINCKATPPDRCRGRVTLDLLGTPAGSTSFVVRANKRGIVPVKLKPKIWTLLMKTKQKRLRVNVTITYKSRGKTVYGTWTLTVSGPRVRQKQGTPPQGK
jgi:hypothetical protein